MIRISPFRWARVARIVNPPRVLAVVWLLAILAGEVYLRTSPSDLVDALGVAALISLLVLTWLVHRTSDLLTVHIAIRVMRSLRARVARYALRMGVDLRRNPPLRIRFPRVLIVLLAAMLVALGVALRFRAFIPVELRSALLRVSPSAYVVLLSAFWFLLLGAAFVLVVFVFACVHNALVNVRRIAGPSRSALEGVLFLVGTGLLIGAATKLPVWFAIAAIWTVAAVSLFSVSIPGKPDMIVIWRQRAGDAGGTMSWTQMVATIAALIAVTLTLLVLLSTGDRALVWSSQSVVDATPLPITTFLGKAVAWTGAVGYVTWAWMVSLKSVIYRFRDPATPQPTRVVLLDRKSDVRAPDVLLRQAGFLVSHACEADGVLVGPVIIQPDRTMPRLEARHEAELAPGGVLHVHPDDLGSSEFHDIVRRCDDVERRRVLLHGLEHAFNAAGARRYAKGRGFWVAPQYWFITSLARDTNEDDSWTVGPPFHRCIPLASRHHLRRVLDAIEIDLIFVEDGVTFPQVRLVFQTIFDIYDLYSGNRAEDRHFDGLSVSGLRIVVHDFTMEHPFRARGYPELDYQEVGRARILHVFRDRGGDSDESELPVDADLAPEPATA